MVPNRAKHHIRAPNTATATAMITRQFTSVKALPIQTKQFVTCSKFLWK